MDDIQLDSEMHWQTRAKAFGGRADLVLPFLNTSGTHGVAVTRVKDPAPRRSTSESKEADAVDVDESCPWCGKGGMPCNEQDIETSGGGGVGGNDLGGRGDVGGGDGELDSASLARRDDILSERATCASCGFTFPNTNLWSVPESTRCSLNWEDVCSAGDRWRGEFCLDAGVRETAGTSQEEWKMSSNFRNTCLRGRDERINMRRRHRREERDLAARVNLSGTKPRSAKLAADVTSRIASMTPSTWRLDEELELGKQQAQERREQAARQLCFHGGGGLDHADTGETGGTCADADLGPSTTAGEQAVQATGNHSDLFDKVRAHQTPGRRQSKAAGLIQRLWRRRQKRTARVRCGLEGGEMEPAKEQAIMKLQSAFRGFHVRRALQVNSCFIHKTQIKRCVSRRSTVVSPRAHAYYF